MKDRRSTPLQILGFGDSLTAGTPGYEPSLDWGDKEFQYGYWLCQNAILAGFKEPSFDNHGVPGELAQTMLPRLISLLDKKEYDVVIVLAGSNDIGWGREVSEIYSDLRSLWLESAKHESIVVACTIPPIRARFSPIQGAQRELNRCILSSHPQIGDFHTVDLFVELSDRNGLLLAEYDSGDGLHLNKTGYRKVGEKIWDSAIKKIMPKTK